MPIAPTPYFLHASKPDAQRMVRLSHWLARACAVLVLALPLSVLLYWALADQSHLATQGHLATQVIVGTLLPYQRALGAALTLVPVLLLCVGLWHARSCFLLFASGQVFSGQAVRRLRQFASWALASVLASVGVASALSVVLTLENPVGMRHLALGLGTDQVFSVFFAGMVWLMAAVISHGQQLADENAAFV